jgi:hypothetical protein
MFSKPVSWNVIHTDEFVRRAPLIEKVDDRLPDHTPSRLIWSRRLASDPENGTYVL